MTRIDPVRVQAEAEEALDAWNARHPYVCACGAALQSEAARDRCVTGKPDDDKPYHITRTTAMLDRSTRDRGYVMTGRAQERETRILSRMARIRGK